jgi:hypothetical protein
MVAISTGKWARVGYPCLSCSSQSESRQIARAARPRPRSARPESYCQHRPAYVPRPRQRLPKGKGAGWNKTHLHQWRKAIDDYLAPIAGLPVAAVDTAAVLRCLTPVWQRIPDTGRKLRGKIEMVLDSATALGLRSGPNPAAWRGHLALILPGSGRAAQATMPR